MATLIIVVSTVSSVVVGLLLGHVIACLFILKRPPFLLPWGTKRLAKRYGPSGASTVAALADFQGRMSDEEYKRTHNGKSWDADDMFGVEEGWGEAVDDLIEEG